jgi:hypothetical protein
MVGRSVTSRPGIPLGSRKRVTPSSPDPPPTRAATTMASARWASGTKSLVPESVNRPPAVSRAGRLTPAGGGAAEGSIQARVALASPAAILGSHSFFWASLPACRIAAPPSSTVET